MEPTATLLSRIEAEDGPTSCHELFVVYQRHYRPQYADVDYKGVRGMGTNRRHERCRYSSPVGFSRGAHPGPID
ncbi:hypothetical protein K439DRAFT_1641311 [Ramaria rubella]|nr:hypothetical protein K439DRAFT_1641311 [Ramaria rubella]